MLNFLGRTGLDPGQPDGQSGPKFDARLTLKCMTQFIYAKLNVFISLYLSSLNGRIAGNRTRIFFLASEIICSKISSLAPCRVCNMPNTKQLSIYVLFGAAVDHKTGERRLFTQQTGAYPLQTAAVKRTKNRWPIVVLRRRDGLQGNRPQGHRTLPYRRLLHLPVGRAQPLVGQELGHLHSKIR
jgi:hypothetical protein